MEWRPRPSFVMNPKHLHFASPLFHQEAQSGTWLQHGKRDQVHSKGLIEAPPFLIISQYEGFSNNLCLMEHGS